MASDILHSLMTYWEHSWYTSMILFLLTCIAFITGIITFEFKKVRIFFLLFVFSNIISGPEARIIFLKHPSENEKTLFWIYGLVFNSIIEFIAYYYFFFKILKWKFSVFVWGYLWFYFSSLPLDIITRPITLSATVVIWSLSMYSLLSFLLFSIIGRSWKCR